MRIRELLQKTYQRFMEHDCMSSAASIAYFTIFSLPPLIIIGLNVAIAFGFTPDDVNRIISQKIGLPATQFGRTESDADAEQLRDSEPAKVPVRFGVIGLGVASKIVGFGILLGSALAIFAQLQDSLNRIWQVAPDTSRGWINVFIMKRLLSLGMVAAIWFLLLVSLVFTAMIDLVLEIINGAAPGPFARILALLINEGTTLTVSTICFAIIFKILPDAQMRWRDVWIGAGVTGVMFIIGKVAVGYYLRTCQVGADWGNSAASTAAALVWVYYSSLIVLIGAEFTHVWATRDGRVAQPSPGAVRCDRKKRTDATPADTV